MATSTTTTSTAAAAALFFSQKPGLMMLTAIQPQARWRPPPLPSSQRLHLHQITVSCSAESAASKSSNQKSESNERNSSADEEDANGYRSRRPQQQQGRDSSGQRPDTRIHWGTSTEGWIGLEDSALPSSSSSSAASSGGGDDEGGGRNSSSGRRRPGVTDSLRGLLAAAPDSHYQYEVFSYFQGFFLSSLHINGIEDCGFVIRFLGYGRCFSSWKNWESCGCFILFFLISERIGWAFFFSWEYCGFFALARWKNWAGLPGVLVQQSPSSFHQRFLERIVVLLEPEQNNSLCGWL